MSQAGVLSLASSSPTIPTSFVTDSGTAVPISNILEILGAAGTTTAGSGNTVTVTVASISFTWNTITAATQALAVQNGYISDSASLITYTLPVTAGVGDSIKIVGRGAGLFKVAQNVTQLINFTASSTTTGVGGSVTSIDQFCTLELVCTVANTEWTVMSNGNFTIV